MCHNASQSDKCRLDKSRLDKCGAMPVGRSGEFLKMYEMLMVAGCTFFSFFQVWKSLSSLMLPKPYMASFVVPFLSKIGAISISLMSFCTASPSDLSEKRSRAPIKRRRGLLVYFREDFKEPLAQRNANARDCLCFCGGLLTVLPK